METKCKPYNIDDSANRIDDILEKNDASFEELNEIPNRDRLTYSNGFYVNCSCVFVDIRSSSDLPNRYRRPTLAKIYRSYISETVAVLNSSSICKEVNIHGDAVWGVCNTPLKRDINLTFGIAAELSSVIDLLNCHFQKKAGNIQPITVGIGVDYGRALMLQAGYKGSGLNEVVWMGDVVNQASKLSGYGNSSWQDAEMMVSSLFYENLSDHNKSLLRWNLTRDCWNGNVVNITMDKWLRDQNCK
jgi:class 3 adenylate cyclase